MRREKYCSVWKRVIPLAEPTSWIKIDRNILDWRWYKSSTTLQVFLYLLLRANVKPGDFGMIRVLRGQVVTSYSRIAEDLGLSQQEVRTALGHLKQTGEITSCSTSRYSIISVVNYNKYQDGATSKATGKQQATNKRTTGKQQQSKNNKKEDKEKKESSPDYQPKFWELDIPKQGWGRFESEDKWEAWKEEHIEEVSGWLTN